MTLPRRLQCIVGLIAVFVPLVSAQTASQNFPELRWRLIGPFRAGRTVAISGVPADPNTFYMAPNNGGVWKTTDAGNTWNPIFDGQDTGSVGALAVAWSNPQVIYVGSGEGLRRPDLSTGNGVYKTTDGGKSWKHLGLRDGQQIGSIIVDPHNPDRVFVGVFGHPYGPNSERGVFRSLDGGTTWEKVLYKDDNTGAIELEFDPSNPQVVYADMFSARRPPWTTGSSYSGPGSGLYKSTDGGSTWSQLTAGLPTWSDHLGRIGFDIAPSNASRMYAVVDSPKLGGLYRSDNGGERWERISEDDRLWGRGDDFACVRVDPKNPDIVYVANVSTYRSTDGGKTFTAIKGAPGGDDYHNIWINSDNSQIIALAVDQGATISVNGGQTWSSWYNQPTAQFYHVITAKQFPYWVYGGQQESGSIGTASRSDFGEITFRDWYPVGVEEYGYVAPDPLHPNLIYGGKASRFDRTTGQTQDVSPVVLRTGKYRFNRTAPLLFSPTDPHTLYLGSNVLFKTTDGGNSWQVISPDLTREDPGVPATLGVFVDSDPMKGKHRGVIYSLAPSPKDGNLIWAGTDDGLIQLTRDGGKSWKNVTPPDLTPWSKVAQVDASHFDTDTAYAAINRFRLDDLHAYIYRTHDGGKSWQKITAGIPDDAAVNTVREDPVRKGLLFAGTERTVYVSFDDGDHWQTLQNNLPSTSIRDLVIHGDDIVVGTHGRSFWILDDITPLRQLDAKVDEAEAHLYAPQLTYRLRRNNNTDTPLTPEVPAGQNPPDGAIFDYLLKSAANGPVTLEITDSNGKLVRHFSSDDKPDPINPDEINIPTYWIRLSHSPSAEPGMHRFVWDLHYPAPQTAEHEFPISAIFHDTPRYPLGPAVLPGSYTVTLNAAGKTYKQPLTVQMDPRVKTSAADLRRLFDLETAIDAGMGSSFEALQQLHSLQKQLMQAKERAPQLSQEIDEMDKRISELAGKGEGGPLLNGPAGRSLSRLHSALYTILGAVAAVDAAPTTQQQAAYEEVNTALQDTLKQWQDVTHHDLPALNQKVKAAGAPELTLQTSAGLHTIWRNEKEATGIE